MDLNELNKYLDDQIVSLQMFPLIGSTRDEQRLYLRQQLIQAIEENQNHFPHLKEISPETRTSLLNLNIMPQQKLHFISLSHQDDTGVFVIGKKGTHIGVDLENANRVTLKAALRICKQKTERDLIQGRPADLWVLKESAFKALNLHFELQTLSDLQFHDFQPLDEEKSIVHNISAKGMNLQGFKGLSFDQDGFKMGIVIKKGLTLV